MKTLKSIFIIILLSAGCLSAECQKSVTKNKLKSIIVLEEKSDVLIKKQFKESETYYDSRGNILEEITYKQGKVDKHFKYQYDSDDNKIKEEEYDPAGKISESSEYKIENGLRVEKIVFDSNKKIKSRKIYQYTTY
jgi:antitoxin component YwqK of YwqJK toxin-antitoxin module